MHPCIPTTHKGIAVLALRLSFGLSLLLIGIAHYLDLQNYMVMVRDGLGSFEPLGTLWAYILPALMIAGGASLASNMYTKYGAWFAGIALGSIPVGMMLKPVLTNASLIDVMPGVINAYVWLLVYFFVVKCSCCGNCTTEGK